MTISRVLILGIEQSGYSRGLLRGLRKLGHDAKFFEIAPEWPDRKNNNEPEEGIIKLYPPSHGQNLVEKMLGRFAWYVSRLRALGKLRFKDAVIICNSGISLLPMNIDLFIGRVLGAQVVMLCGHGTESRSPVVSSHQSPGDGLGLALLFAVIRKRIVLRYWATCADFFFCSPMTGALAPTPFFNQLDLGHPLDIEKYEAEHNKATDAKEKFRIMHSASSSKTKGSEYICAVMQGVADKPSITFEHFSKLNHETFLRELDGANLFVDQAFSDYPLPVAAAEAMAMKCLVLVSGYFVDFPSPYTILRPPVFTCLPQNLKKKVEEVLDLDSTVIEENINLGFNFIKTNFTDIVVAKKLLDLIAGNFQHGIGRVFPSRYKFGAGLLHSEITMRTSKPLIRLTNRFWRLY